MIVNAKEQLEKTISLNDVICAYILLSTPNFDDDLIEVVLKENFTEKEFNEFLNKLNFEYDKHDNSKNQHLYPASGTVWFENEIWVEFGHKDDGMGWILKFKPIPPKVCF